MRYAAAALGNLAALPDAQMVLADAGAIPHLVRPVRTLALSLTLTLSLSLSLTLSLTLTFGKALALCRQMSTALQQWDRADATSTTAGDAAAVGEPGGGGGFGGGGGGGAARPQSAASPGARCG